MLHRFVSNGDTQLILVPTTDTERVLLKALLSQEVEVAAVQDHLTILGVNLNGGIIIQRKQAGASGEPPGIQPADSSVSHS